MMLPHQRFLIPQTERQAGMRRSLRALEAKRLSCPWETLGALEDRIAALKNEIESSTNEPGLYPLF